MKNNRHSKLVAILALCVSVVGLTLGFAAFSNTLTISSSAIVKPDESDFNINVYGYEASDNYDYLSLDGYKSSTLSKPLLSAGAESATDAKISDNGKSISISDISVQMKQPGDWAIYYFLIKNEGEYDAYLDLTNILDLWIGDYGVAHSCTAGTNTTVDLVNGACDYVHLSGILLDSEWYDLGNETSVMIEKGDHLFLELNIDYGDDEDSVIRADGDFSVDFDDLVLEFSSVPPQS